MKNEAYLKTLIGVSFGQISIYLCLLPTAISSIIGRIMVKVVKKIEIQNMAFTERYILSKSHKKTLWAVLVRTVIKYGRLVFDRFNSTPAGSDNNNNNTPFVSKTSQSCLLNLNER